MDNEKAVKTRNPSLSMSEGLFCFNQLSGLRAGRSRDTMPGKSKKARTLK